MRILIVGAGSVGLGIASCLLKAAAEVDLLGKEDTVASLCKHGLHRTGIFGDFQADPSEFLYVTGRLQGGKPDQIHCPGH